MEIRVLGSYGSRVPGHQSSCLLIDRCLALDAGGLTGILDVGEQLAVDHVLISHAHLDHVYDLAFLVDNVASSRQTPLRIWAPVEVLAVLRQHLFNGQIWPDMTDVFINGCRVMEFCPLAEGRPTLVGGFSVQWVQTAHTVFSAGYLVTRGGVSLLYTGDTTCTDDLWAMGRKANDLAVVFAEASFPNRMQDLARLTGHLTPELLAVELKKLGRPHLPVKVYHMKPQHIDEIGEELASQETDYQMLQGNEVFRF